MVLYLFKQTYITKFRLKRKLVGTSIAFVVEVT